MLSAYNSRLPDDSRHYGRNNLILDTTCTDLRVFSLLASILHFLP